MLTNIHTNNMRSYVATCINSADPLSVFAYTTNHPEPDLPSDTAVLVRVVYAGVNPADLQYVNGQYEHAPAHPMPCFPAPLGVEGAGIVVRVGSKVTKFKQGDQVLGLHQRMDEGTFAEVASFEEHELAYKPPTVCWQVAAATPVAGVTALSALLCCPGLKAVYKGSSATSAASSANSSPAGQAAAPAGPEQAAAEPHSLIQSILILGASGGVGSFAVMLAKHFFRIPVVIATCSGGNATYVQQLGADVIIDYTSQDVQQAALRAVKQENLADLPETVAPCVRPPAVASIAAAAAETNCSSPCSSSPRNSSSNHKLDLIIDNVGGSDNMSMACRLLKPSGLYVTSVPLADPHDASFSSVLSFFFNLGVRKLQHVVSYKHCPAVAFNGATADGRKVQRIVDWLAASDSILHSSDAHSSLLRVTEYDLSEAGTALQALHSKHAVGKLVLKVADAAVQTT